MIKDEKRYCDCCGKEFAGQKDLFLEDFLHIEKEWGYFSEQDGINLSADVCEKCLMEWIDTFCYRPKMCPRTVL